jgi:hypothetical protein
VLSAGHIHVLLDLTDPSIHGSLLASAQVESEPISIGRALSLDHRLQLLLTSLNVRVERYRVRRQNTPVRDQGGAPPPQGTAVKVLRQLIGWGPAIVAAVALITSWFDEDAKFSDTTTLRLVLALLLMIAIGELLNRSLLLERIMAQTERLTTVIPNPSLGDALFDRDQLVSLDDTLRDRQLIELQGVSLAGVLIMYETSLRGFAEKGGSIKAMILDPASQAADAISKSLFGLASPGDLKADVVAAVKCLVRVGYGTNPRIEARMIDIVPFASLTHFCDVGRSGGVIVGSLLPYKISTEHRPHFYLTSDTSQWYRFFVDQIGALWDQGTAIPPDYNG